nr:type IV secretion system protein [Chloroflexota bacterium]
MRGLRAWLAAHRRLLCIAVGVGLVLVAWAHPPAGASAGDVFQSTGPPTQVGTDTLINRWPLSHYALDLHVDKIDINNAPDIPDVPKLILYGLTDLIWQITAFLTWLVIQLFTFAFSLDLLQGSEATNGQGALEPVSRAVDNLYGSTIGEPWLVLAIVAVGLWGVKTALAQRRISETISAFTTSLVFAVIALWFVTNPAGSVGFIADKSNEVSAAFLSVSSSGEVVGQERARNDATDQLFKAHVYDPWLVLNFGGTRHCVTSESLDRAEEGETKDIDATLVGINAYGPPPNNAQGDPVSRECYDSRRYAGSYLHYNVDDEDRKGEDESSYAAINEGDPEKWPEGLPDSYKVDLDAGDAAAVSMQESSGVTQRLGTAVVIFLANLGVIILLGALSIAVILAQILALLLLLFAPIALVIGIFPGRGHDFFRKWLIKLITALFRKAIYSFVIAVLLAAAAALTAASANLGWLMAFGLQATFYWMVFLYRKQIVGAMTAATTAGEGDEGGSKAAQVYYKSKIAMGVGK